MLSKNETKTIIIGHMALFLNAVLALVNDRSQTITENYNLFLLSKVTVILSCVLGVLLAVQSRPITKVILMVSSIAFMCSGEMMSGGYNLAYIQLVIFIPLALKLTHRQNLFYILCSFLLFSVCLMSGETSKITISNYPSYFSDVIVSILTSTLISVLLSTLVRKNEIQLDVLKVGMTKTGAEVSLIIHNIKNELLTLYRFLRKYDGEEEILINGYRGIDDSIRMLEKLIGNTTTSACSPRVVISDLGRLFEKKYPFLTIKTIGESDNIGLSKDNIESIFCHIFLNAIKYRNENEPVQIKISFKKRSIVVEDNGLGFHPDSMNNLNANTPYSNNENSSGLGLLHSKVLLASVGSEIYFSNLPRRGAKIKITY